MIFSDGIFRNKAKRRAHNKDMGEGECDICYAPSPKPLKQGLKYRCRACREHIEWSENYEMETYNRGETDA